MQSEEADHTFEEIQGVRGLLKLEEISWIKDIWNHGEKLNDIKSIGPVYSSVVPRKVEREYFWLVLQNVNIILPKASAFCSVNGIGIPAILLVNVFMSRS